jgi:hypothetical protein
MMGNLSIVTTLILALFFALGCGVTGSQIVNISLRDTNEAASVMNKASSAIASVMGTGGTGLQGSGSNFMATADFECDENGGPVLSSDGTTRLQAGTNENWAAAKIYCLIEKNSYSPETIQGSIALTRGILCALGELTYDGTQVTKTISVDLTCFDQSTVTEMASAGASSFEMNITPSTLSGDWDYQVVMEEPTGNVFAEAMTMKIKDSGGIKAAAMSEPDSTAGKYGSWSVTIDQTNGKIWYESMDYRLNASGEGWNRHARAFVSGTLNSSYEFTAVSDVQAIWSDLQKSGSNYGATIATAKGNDTDGFKTRTYSMSGQVSAANVDVYASYDINENDCFPTAAGCAGNNGIEFSANGDFDFVLLPSLTDSYPNSVWYAALTAPLDFDPVTIALTNP